MVVGIRCVSCDRENQLHYSTIRKSNGGGRRRDEAPEGWLCDECVKYHWEMEQGMRMMHPAQGRQGYQVSSRAPPGTKMMEQAQGRHGFSVTGAPPRTRMMDTAQGRQGFVASPGPLAPPTCAECNASAVNGGSWKRTTVGGPWSCGSCSTKPKINNAAVTDRDLLGVVLGSASSSSLAAKKVGPITCPKNHSLVLYRLGSSWTCDQCEKNFEAGTCCNRCETCDYDVCPMCVINNDGGSTTAKGMIPRATWEVVYRAVNVRAAPSAEAAVVGSKVLKDEVQELERSGKWIQVAPHNWMLTDDGEYTLLKKKE